MATRPPWRASSTSTTASRPSLATAAPVITRCATATATMLLPPRPRWPARRGRGGSNIVAVAVAHLVITGAAVARLGLLAVVEVELARHGGRVERGIDGGRLILGAHVLPR